MSAIEKRIIRGFLRYMDDFILFGQEREHLKTELGHIKEFLTHKLALELKENIQLNRCNRGIPFLGYRVFPRKILFSPKSRKRFRKKFRKYEENWEQDLRTERELARHMEPLVEFTKAAHAKGFRLNVIERFGVSS